MSDDNDDLFWRDMEARLDQDEDEAFHRAMDDLEPPQRGGAAAAATVEDEASGAGPSRAHFDFRLDPFVDRRSQRLGVHERALGARVHQRGTFDHHNQLAARFVEGLRISLAQMLQDPSIADRDRVYFHLASDRLGHAYDAYGKPYFRARCYQPYNDAGQHACTNNPNHCGGCLQNGCSD